MTAVATPDACKASLTNIFKSCLNILRDNEGLTGDKALRTLSHLLILKLIEPQFGGAIDIDNYDYDFSEIEDANIESHKRALLKIVRFSALATEDENNIPTKMKYLWDDILSAHPATKHIFLKNKGFDIQRQSTYKKLIDKINTLPTANFDVLGNAYEEVIQDIMTGKILGQFFTQPAIKKLMISLIDPQVYPDGTIETVCDPAMGTGGLLITYLQDIMRKAAAQSIPLDWDFIKTTGIYGKELEPDTYQLAVSNMLISSGHMFNQLERGDSIRDPITRKFNNIAANPPFGIKGLNYDEFSHSLKDTYVPIKTNNAVSLFVQAIICMLNIEGRCAIVLPYGKDLFGQTGALVAVREYLLKTCDLREIICLPSGIFTYTSISTGVFYFVKKVEGTDVLQTSVKLSKTQKETGRTYAFADTHQTTSVKFYNFVPNEGEGVKTLLVEVPIESIANKAYSLVHGDYLPKKTETYQNNVAVQPLGEICTFLPKSKRNAKYGSATGAFPFFKSSVKTNHYVDTPDYSEESIIIGDGGEPNVNYGMSFSASDHCYILQNTRKTSVRLKYVYYYLYHNLDIMSALYTGVAIKNISKTSIENIQIPIPSFERQEHIAKYLDFIYETANKTSIAKIAELMQLNKYCIDNQQLFGQNTVSTLGNICVKITAGKFNSKDSQLAGTYPFYTNKATNPDGYWENYCFDYEKYIILIKDGGAGSNKYGDHIGLGKVFKVHGKSGGTSHQYALIIKSELEYKIKFEYLYYYLKNIKNDIMDLAHYTTGLGCIKKGDIENIQILLPSIERQQEIIDYCDHNFTLIDLLNQEIKNNEMQARQFMASILNVRPNHLADEQPTNNNDDNPDSTVLPLAKTVTIRVKKSKTIAAKP